jgi:SAM-dependent methyltransferase
MNQSDIDIPKISADARERYSLRYQVHGYSPLSLGWGALSHQETRFTKIIHSVELSKKSILDIGCGFGDFCHFLSTYKIDYLSYTGWDIVNSFIEEAKQRYPDHRNTFEICNLNDLLPSEPLADVCLMIGLLNWNLGSKEKNMQYTRYMLYKAFGLCKEFLVVDFLSANFVSDYPPESTVFYHEPAEVIELTSSLSSNFKLFHDYPAIPQKEFMIVIYK